MGWAYSTYKGEERGILGLVGNPEGKIPLGRPTRRLDYNIKNGSLGSGMGCMDWIDLAQDRDKFQAFMNG
jgi:hypothetical protein